MVLQVRITDSDGSSPVILESAMNISYSKALNSQDEGISFEIAKNDPKSDMLNPYDESSFTRLWEVWDTVKNKRLNLGPLTKIDDGSSTYKVSGAGRSAFLLDHYTTVKTFYARIDSVLDEIRYENVAISPSASTMVVDLSPDDAENTGGSGLIHATIDDKYHNLSKKSKDFAIDSESSYIPFGKTEPSRTFSTTSQYWTGMGVDDTLVVDLGDDYPISKIRLLFPWWGGPQRATNRSYDFEVQYAAEGPSLFQGRPIQTVLGEIIFDSSPELHTYINQTGGWYTGLAPLSTELKYWGNRIVTTPKLPIELYLGTSMSGTGTNLNTFYTALNHTDPITMRYLGIHIYNVNAWYGNNYDTNDARNFYGFQCDPAYRPEDYNAMGSRLGLMTYRKNGVIKEREIADTVIKPANDCNASIVEIGAFQEIVNKKVIKPLAIQRIDNNNRQISYFRIPDATELRTYTLNGVNFKKFEPGTFFRRFGVSWASANTEYNKFFRKDCPDCYPDGFHFAIVDDDSTMIYSADYVSGTENVRARQYTKHVLMKGGSGRTIDWVDAWKGKTDPLSWGGSYSFTEKTGDYFVLSFRGESLKWYATIPSSKTGARVKIEYRKKEKVKRLGITNKLTSIWLGGDGTSLVDPLDFGWRTLEADYQLPSGVSNQVVYEIPYEGDILEPETVYELKVTLLDNGYCSIDSIEGYWSASFTDYNEDSSRITISQPSEFKQIYDKKFTNGSMYKWNKSGAGATIQFEGDRLIIQSAKGRNHGNLTLLLYQYNDTNTVEYDPGVDNHVFIPGGDPDDGSLVVSLETSKRGQEFPNYIIFDSNDYFGNYGLPWGKYTMSIAYRPAETYLAKKGETGSDSFQYRCRSCNPSTSGDVTINKYVYLDAIGVHERIGLSVNFDQQPHLEILKSVAEAIQVEWDVAEEGLIVEPRIGRDTNIALREGENTVVSYSIANDMQKVATRLLSYGTAIDGIDQFAITEDKKSRSLFKRTITRQNDFRDVGSYQQLIGLSRMELKRRNRPERRVSVAHTAEYLDLLRGDSFILWTKKSGNMRLRINNLQISESMSGTTYTLECVEWPQIR